MVLSENSFPNASGDNEGKVSLTWRRPEYIVLPRQEVFRIDTCIAS